MKFKILYQDFSHLWLHKCDRCDIYYYYNVLNNIIYNA